jgi:hypothetical protein
MRQWLLNVSERIAFQRGYFHQQAETHWHLAHTLGKMVDRRQLPE